MTGGDSTSRLWLYHKPPGLSATRSDRDDPETIFAHLPDNLPSVVAIGHLDRDAEGLLLLTDDEALPARRETPETHLTGTYRVQVQGTPDPVRLAKLAEGVSVASVNYGAIEAAVESGAAETWVKVSLQEAKGRDIRRLMLHVGLRAIRMIHTQHGPFALGDLQPGGISEVAAEEVRRLLG